MRVINTGVRFILVKLLLFAIVFVMLTSAAALAGKRNGNGAGFVVLSEAEAVILNYMREEEKMARDVYLLMDETWGAAIFSTIAVSEQNHMDAIKKKLDKYGLPDPALPEIGFFTDPELQAKYDELVALGGISYVDGLYAGATIEEVDMIDIQYAIDITTHLDVVNTYQNLLEGSKNHLRAFVGGLAAQGIVYTPQFISLELFDAIMGL